MVYSTKFIKSTKSISKECEDDHPWNNEKTNSYTWPSDTLLDEESQDSSQNVMINTLDTLTLFGDKRLNISYIY